MFKRVLSIHLYNINEKIASSRVTLWSCAMSAMLKVRALHL